MNTTVSSIQKKIKIQKHYFLLPAISIFLFTIYQIDSELFNIFVQTISDAYLAVSVFVAITLFIVYSAHLLFKTDLIGYLNKKRSIQVPIATFLGLLPGCGGAIIIVTQFVQGKVSFGALVAVLISTMGDASFLLLATEPSAAFIVFSISSVAAIISGYTVDKIHDPEYLKAESQISKTSTIDKHIPIPKLLLKTWLWILAPGFIFGILLAFQVDTDSFFGRWRNIQPTMWLGFIGAMCSIAIWFSRPLNSWSIHQVDSESNASSSPASVCQSVASETCFVTIWVIAGFLVFELFIHFTGWNLGHFFKSLGGLTPLLAILVGFIPGCGPQIIMTTLYLQGVVPLSAQLANAISNDGDALFPAIAMAPKAAIYATLYSAIPAIIIGYCVFAMGY